MPDWINLDVALIWYHFYQIIFAFLVNLSLE